MKPLGPHEARAHRAPLPQANAENESARPAMGTMIFAMANPGAPPRGQLPAASTSCPSGPMVVTNAMERPMTKRAPPASNRNMASGGTRGEGVSGEASADGSLDPRQSRQAGAMKRGASGHATRAANSIAPMQGTARLRRGANPASRRATKGAVSAQNAACTERATQATHASRVASRKAMEMVDVRKPPARTGFERSSAAMTRRRLDETYQASPAQKSVVATASLA